MRKFLLLALPLVPVALGQTISIEEYEPKSTLRVPEHKLTRAKFPFIDVHNHQREVSPEKLDKLVADMDSLNMQILINSPVSGGSGKWVANMVTAMKGKDPNRFAVMTNIDYNNLEDPNYGTRVATQLEADIKAGAIGLKIWKHLGMMLNDSKGRVKVDDPRFDPVWEMCAKHKIPVLIHTGDPWGLFQPMDKNNERWLELKLRSGRNQSQQTNFTWEQLIEEQHALFARHPKTIFVNAHLGWLGHDLGRLGELLDRLPNVYAEVGAITSELGRQPRAARRFFVKYQDRILFGKDLYSVPEYYTYFRLFETDDDYFDPIRKYHGIWKLYGLDLPDDVLKKVYYKNALRIFPGLSSAGFPE
ncbi:amidohydrolase family protein [Horticoccus sp. 23ND18S-11]|uniref:amidohydrolase family protein n=1 Tax=Horticoccus sp. 23ND18S-11 TaxID=3391832 RepID=UPI0039C9E82A